MAASTLAGRPASPSAGSLPPAADEVHCWWASLDVPPETSARLSATLTADERDRGARFRFERDRRHFIAARGMLRHVLGRYLETEPGRIEFVYNAFGKPDLAPQFGERLRFSLSHAGGRALVAVAMDSRVGVDLEFIRSHPGHADIARHFFSAWEVEQLSAIPGDRYDEAFLACWTKKEAWLKACGYGLTIPLNRVSVPLTTLVANDPVELCLVSDDLAEMGHWAFHTLRPAPGCIGALAVEGGGRRLSRCEWSAIRG